ncbi:DUF1214 domain-containing protein [Erythrobacter sp. WG]|uniref:DUF1214 domain-containing protein n=1 Tax=Erythrobacter sp. WG TaxID=2985510 RepID=UPI002271DF57|nr:DUF1214 domain-containing protein [Erythrobacter sp. WG]MCX9148135.1 DUF1214 domain-containing protein [Erythrobacter sp. WG]
MMRRALAYLAAVLAGSALGLGSALFMAGLWPPGRNLAFGDVDVGGWRSDFAVGSKAADPYTRARVARHGLLALAKTEAVYFTRATDDAGGRLRESCTYRLSGDPMPAAWWSVTLYDGASMLPANDDDALSIDAEVAGEGAWSAIIAPRRPAGGAAWISSRAAGEFDLTLRLYMPSRELLAQPTAALSPPHIERLSCEGAG